MELPLQIKVDQEVMVIKEYSTFFRALGLKPHQQIA